MRLNFSEMQLKDIDNLVIPDSKIHKTIANILWKNARTLDLVDKALAINRGEVVEFNDKEIVELTQLIKNPNSGMYAFARKQTLEFIKSFQEPEVKPEKPSSE